MPIAEGALELLLQGGPCVSGVEWPARSRRLGCQKLESAARLFLLQASFSRGHSSEQFNKMTTRECTGRDLGVELDCSDAHRENFLRAEVVYYAIIDAEFKRQYFGLLIAAISIFGDQRGGL